MRSTLNDIWNNDSQNGMDFNYSQSCASENAFNVILSDTRQMKIIE